MKILLILFLAFVSPSKSTTQFNPLKDPSICGRPTCTPGGKFNYQPGVKQQYQYSIDISTLFAGTSKNESTLHIDAKVSLDFISKCEGILSFSDVKLKEKPDVYDRIEDVDHESPTHDQSPAFADAISQHFLRFSFHDGVISEICPHEAEPNWVLNIKRGVLSLMHNTMHRFDLDHQIIETDVHGTCPTEYKLQGARGTSLIIEKTKDIASCQDRYKHHSILQTTHYNFRSNYQAMPIMKSSVYCELSIDHHVYNGIECRESHIFQPFSNQDAGATTTTKQRLLLISETTELLEMDHQPPIEKRSNLLYNHIATPKPTSGELKVSRDLIKRLCKLSTDDMQIEFSDLFTKFIHTSRLLSHTALFQLYSRATIICSSGKKHLLDALPFLGSSAAVQLMKDIIVKGDVSKDTAHEWMLAFALIPRPNEAMLPVVGELLEHDRQDPAVALSVSSVVHAFCKGHINCQDNEHVAYIVSVLEGRVTAAYESRREDRATRETVLVSLKALANIGTVTDEFKTLLMSIIRDEEFGMDMKVAAVDAHRRLPCDETRDYFLELLRDQRLDSEIRIASYLQVMRCPNYLIIRTIKHCLEVEEVNQVGSFIWSHLHNLLKSSIPSRIEIQGLLSDKDLGKKFSSDVRKFSHNYEGSVFFDEYNVGANYESNVIFSPSSFIPKSAMLNLTVDLFGESINLFEVNSRMEGFEHYLESMFGPKGPFNSKFIQEQIAKIRWPRSAPQEENDILKSEINNLPNMVDNKFGEPKVSLGLKVFGNELKYHTFNGNKEISTALRKLNPVDHLKEMLSGQEINYNKAAMFLDTSYIVSTGAGLPITLNAVGTAAVNLKMYGSLRGADFMKTKELDLIGSIRPSATVDIVGTMSVDAYYASTGIKLKTNVYTSTAVEGHVKMRGSRLVSIKFSLPNDKTEIFSAQSEIVVMRGLAEEHQAGIVENRIEQTMCSWPAVDKTIGLKLCADYQFPNVTKLNHTSYFILAGPVKARVSLQKADLTAKTYLLEYKWENTKNASVISLVFDTPGSSIKRLLSTNLTIDVQSQNLTLFLETAAGTTLAKGKYKNTDDEKYVYLGLDINGKKHFDARLSMTRKESKYGFTYQPKFYLGVNDERVAELNGTLRSVTKKGILQWEVDLNFQTKKLFTNLSGYVSKSDASLATKLNMNYRFLNGPNQTVNLEFKISDRSANLLRSYHSDFRLECSAYPRYNFEASLKYQTTSDHVDCKLDLNTGLHMKDKNHTLTAQFVFMNANKHDAKNVRSRKLNTYIEVKKPATQLDWKLQFRYKQTGPAINAMALARYAKDKTISVVLYLSTPRTSLLYVEGKLNVTLPSFTPMVLEGNIHEKIAQEFDIDLKAVWFSGYNITARGRYQDRSSRIASSYHLKLLIQSPSFHEINLGCLYDRDESELKLEIKAYHNNEEYSLLIKHASASAYEVSTFAEIKYKTKVYSVTSLVNLQDYRQIMLELHIDQWRDIHLVVRGRNEDNSKELGVEVKWDANRDPDQKLMVSVEFHETEPYHYKGNFLVSYPGRIINGIFEFALWGIHEPWRNKINEAHYMTFVRLAWSATEFIELNLSADYKYEGETLLTIKSELLTPFESWKRTSVNGGYRHIGNMYHTNGSVYWQHDQHISVDFFGDYNVTDTDLKCELRSSVISAIHEIPSLSASLKHSQNTTKMDTNLHVTYDPRKSIVVKSLWEIAQDETSRNLTGTVALLSPFTGYNKGLLVSKIYISRDNHVRGIADLDLDHKKYTATVKGHLKKLTDNMFVFNITTPIEKYKQVTGRFGFSEEEKHVVAEVRGPSGAIGVELLFQITSISNFNVKFNLATPIDFIQNALLVGKLKPDRVDFRLGWNNLQAGFAGVWHYVNLRDFEYSYKIYTPIDEYEENGIVAKLIIRDGLDLEFTVKLASSKVGIAVLGKPKPKLLKELGINTPNVYTANRRNNATIEGITSDNGTQDKEKDAISWTGLIELDTIIYPTLKGTLDVDERGTLYTVLVTLTLPDGVAELRDELDIIAPLTMNNQLKLTTPYACYRELTSSASIDIQHQTVDKEYNVTIDLNILNGTNWIKTGLEMYYRQQTEDGPSELEARTATVRIHTPLASLPSFYVHTALEIEENVYRVNFMLTTNSTDISVFGAGEADEGFLDTTLNFHVISPSLNLPVTNFSLKKDFSEVEYRLDMYLDMILNKKKNYTMRTLWHIRSIKHFDIELKTELPIQPLQYFDGKVSLLTETDIKSATLRFVVPPNSINANATLKENVVHSDVLADLLGERYSMSFDGNIVESTEKQHSLMGLLKYGDIAFDVNGYMEMQKDFPLAMNIELVPVSGGEKIMVKYTIQPQESGYALRSNLNRGSEFGIIEAHLTTKHKYDWDVQVKVDTSMANYKSAVVNAKMITPHANNVSFVFDAKTPFKGLEMTRFGYSIVSEEITGSLYIYHEVANSKGTGQLKWRWLLMKDMGITLIGNHQIDSRRKDVAIDLFYVNPNRSFEIVKFGGDVNVDKDAWMFGSNLTVWVKSPEIKELSSSDIGVKAYLKLPTPKKDAHSVVVNYNTTTASHSHSVAYRALYNSVRANHHYGLSGNILLSNKTNTRHGNLKLDWGPTSNHSINNFLLIRQLQSNIDLSYRLITPKYFNEDTFNSNFTYRGSLPYHNVTVQLFYPASRQITDAKVDYNGLANMNGTVNVTTTFKDVPYAGAHFNMETRPTYSKRQVQAFWINNSALIDSRFTHKAHYGNSEEATGVLLLELPLATRHIAKVDYGYTENPLHTTGYATVEYNKKKVLEGKYNCVSESRAGYDKDTINVEMENAFSPVGLLYVHQFEYDAPGDGSNLPTVDIKRVEVFELHNHTKFNVTGEIHVRSTFTGQQIAITAIHSNRTVTLNADYDVQDQRFLQNSRLQLAPSIWIAYDLDIINNTVNNDAEAQQVEINVSYPRRNFTFSGAYNITNTSLSSEMCLQWDKAMQAKTLQASLSWEQVSQSPVHQEIEFQLKHPSFEKNVSFKGEFHADDTRIADVRMMLEYSNDPNKKLHLSGTLEDHSTDTVRNYTYGITGSHLDTNLELFVQGSLDYNHVYNQWYHVHNYARYKRTFLPMEFGTIDGRVDIDKKQAMYNKKTRTESSYCWGRYATNFPLYTANVSRIRGDEVNESGEFYLHFWEKLLRLELNMTEDGSQSFHMYGVIPDARSASFNVWKDYEDIHVSDVAYFLRLNHSRLLVASLKWRPEIKHEIKAAVRAATEELYGNFSESVDYWKQYIRSETNDAVKDIWEDAKPIVHGFLDDMKALKVLEEDIDVLKTFLNDSYNANEFYVRDIVAFGMSVIDEMSIKSHIESLPAIVNEIWDVMGESGQAIRKSLVWIIETIKNSYKKAALFINGLIKGDAMEQLQAMMERVVENYDKLIKDLHVSFIKYMENLWDKIYVSLVNQWHKLLQTIEPTFIKLAHYAETIVYNTVKEFLDFIYIRTNELVESPYFNQFSNFTADVDKFYKDITGSDTISVIYKYSNILLKFLKEKYFTMVPFGKELQDIATEILNELQELRKLPSIQYITAKWDECYAKVKWFYDYFDVANRVRHFVNLVHLKLTDITQTALQAENRYREAKTKFIFDPKMGTLHLEQKLPISWHAFNETPKFEEIPEYKAISELQSYFTSSNTTFWTLYYDYKPYTDPKDWLPPFNARAMIAGSQLFMTFDRKFYEFRGSCTYLLAHDFLDGNFSVAVTYDPTTKGETHQLHLVLKNRAVVHIDVFSNTISIGNSSAVLLPVAIEDSFIYQEADILTVESSSGFSLRCNMKFDVCMLDVSGWYFGKTAGLWGTINNEPSDDFLASTKWVVPHIGRFAQSWSLQPQTCSTLTNQAVEISEPDAAIVQLCDSLFTSKVSPFQVCFQRVDARLFRRLCLNSVTEMQACTTALSYIEACSVENTPLRIPDTCVKCNLVNGVEVGEGKFIQLNETDIPQSTDVVFIVEAKDCNADIKDRRNIDTLVSLLHRELNETGITENRYSLVVFGGNGVFDEARSVVTNNNIFTTHEVFPSYFENIIVGNGSSDIFDAISFAARLVFRPGVSKTFILIPCSNCESSKMKKLDYAALHQLLREYDITLHILMNEDFRFEKSRINKVFFGMDHEYAYTKKDGRILKGDKELRRQVKLPKYILGFCTPLALETNGTVFSGKKLEGDKRNAVKKFATVFAKRVAKTTVPSPCRICECNAHDDGVSFMECYPCQNPTPAFIDYDFNEDEIDEDDEDNDEQYDSSEE